MWVCHLLTQLFPSATSLLSIIPILFILESSEATTLKDSVLPVANENVPDFVTRHAPLVFLHSEDLFRPADLLEHVLHTIPIDDRGPIPGLPELNLDNLAILNEASKEKVALTATDNVSTLPTWLFGKTPDTRGRIQNATPCVTILVEKSPHDFDVFYFYFYSYNLGGNFSQLVEPLRYFVDETNKMNFGNHVGDWEYNMIRFYDGEPTGIFYSQHEGGAACNWNDSKLIKKGERPLVYSAYGSHANYPSPGNNVHDTALFDYCDDGLLWDPVLSAYFYHFDPSSFTLNRLSLQGIDATDANYTSFFYFTGTWGDAQYSDDDPRQKTIPVLGLKRYVSGPTGPFSKDLVRKGLVPDHQHTSWLQKVASIFMFFYPCCLRGWRVFISGMVVTVLVLSAFYIVKFGVRRYRGVRYARIKTSIMDDDDAYELQSLGINYRDDE